MLILDTDHISHIERNTRPGRQLVERLDRSDQLIAITIVSVEEQLRGLLLLVKRARQAAELTRDYARLQSYLADLTEWTILPWTDEAEIERSRVKAARVRMGTMDLRIACIALADNGRPLTANLRDFEKGPGLRDENRLAA